MTLDTQVQSEQERRGLLGVAALLASIRANANVIVALLRSRAMLNLLEDTPLGQLLLAEWEARGRAEGLRQALMHQLQRRFGDVPEDIAQRLLDIRDTERLNALVDAVFDAQDIQEFRQQIGP